MIKERFDWTYFEQEAASDALGNSQLWWQWCGWLVDITGLTIVGSTLIPTHCCRLGVASHKCTGIYSPGSRVGFWTWLAYWTLLPNAPRRSQEPIKATRPVTASRADESHYLPWPDMLSELSKIMRMQHSALTCLRSYRDWNSPQHLFRSKTS